MKDFKLFFFYHLNNIVFIVSLMYLIIKLKSNLVARKFRVHFFSDDLSNAHICAGTETNHTETDQ